MERRSFTVIFAACLGIVVLAPGCGSRSNRESQLSNEKERANSDQSSSSQSTAKPTGNAARPVIVAFGDSLTAGVVQNSYPAELQRVLDDHGYRYRVENQGVAGDTTTDGLARIENVIAAHPALVILEFGGNDGLRGVPVEAIKANLEQMILRLKQANIPLVLAGITLPPNYGAEYVTSFTAIFPDLAKKYSLRLIPFLLVDVYRHSDMMQPDGIHPSGEGNKIVAQDVFHLIQPLLAQTGKK
ncbi:MAG: arylesterase [Acidobacteriaceae bacterium]|nr:arylesterase [Acidobacteriaceae bacterium]